MFGKCSRKWPVVLVFIIAVALLVSATWQLFEYASTIDDDGQAWVLTFIVAFSLVVILLAVLNFIDYIPDGSEKKQ